MRKHILVLGALLCTAALPTKVHGMVLAEQGGGGDTIGVHDYTPRPTQHPSALPDHPPLPSSHVRVIRRVEAFPARPTAISSQGHIAYYAASQYISRRAAATGQCFGAFHSYPMNPEVISDYHRIPLGVVVTVHSLTTGATLRCTNADQCAARDCWGIVVGHGIVAEVDYSANQLLCPWGTGAHPEERPEKCLAALSVSY